MTLCIDYSKLIPCFISIKIEINNVILNIKFNFYVTNSYIIIFKKIFKYSINLKIYII